MALREGLVKSLSKACSKLPMEFVLVYEKAPMDIRMICSQYIQRGLQQYAEDVAQAILKRCMERAKRLLLFYQLMMSSHRVAAQYVIGSQRCAPAAES
jgi:hypothetical protein